MRSRKIAFSLVVIKQVMSLYIALICDVGHNYSWISPAHGLFLSRTKEVTLRADGIKWSKEHKDCSGESCTYELPTCLEKLNREPIRTRLGHFKKTIFMDSVVTGTSREVSWAEEHFFEMKAWKISVNWGKLIPLTEPKIPEKWLTTSSWTYCKEAVRVSSNLRRCLIVFEVFLAIVTWWKKEYYNHHLQAIWF